MSLKVKKIIGILGLGYVGLPLAVEFGKKYQTIGFDKNNIRISELNTFLDKTLELTEEELKSADIKYTTELADISDCNIYIVTVPTPVDKYNNPDMSSLSNASKAIGSLLNLGDLVIYESTVYPGATEEYCVPILEIESKLKYNIDFFCGYSPERINPGDKEHSLTTIQKVTSGSTLESAKFIDKLYQSIVPAGTHMASSIAVAEAAKVIENIQRDVNISLINELSKIFNKLNIDTMEVLEAAGTKWNFLPFQPGIVGGHCIGVDPYYLTHKAIEIGYHPEIILAGRRINDSMGKYIADAAISEMVKFGINPVNARVAILGLTFKENCPDLRNTKVPDIINHLRNYNISTIVSDPYADPLLAKKMYDIDLVNLKDVENCDVLILAVSHDEYKSIQKNDWLNYFNSKGIFVDVKSMYSKGFFNGTNLHHWKL